MTTNSGRSAAACARRASVDVCAARATTRKRSGSPSSTSTAWVPIEPVEPNRLTERISSPEVKCLDHEICGGQDEKEPVHAVQDAPVTWHQTTHVLHAEMALYHRLAEVADRRHHRHHDPQHEGLADRPRMDEVHHDHRDQHRGNRAAEEPLPALV